MYKDDDYNYWLANIPGIGNITIDKLLERFKSAKAVFYAKDSEILETDGVNIKHLLAINESGRPGTDIAKSRQAPPFEIKCIYKTSENYPGKLKELYDAPFCLFYKGRLPNGDAPAVAVVGARGCSEYGRNQAYKLAYDLAKKGVQIISGLAAGIDSAAHRGALDAGGYTAAVMGNGADICYPRDNFDIYCSMSVSGGIISEFPPGSSPAPGHFPMRNRIISALADAVVIIEARERSGSLITADQALEQGRDVYALPGRVTDPLSRGCLWLIEQGAFVLTDPEDILSSPVIAGKIKKTKCPEKTFTPSFDLPETEKKILSVLGDEPLSLNRLADMCSLSPGELTSHILDLTLSGHIREVSAGLYVQGQK